MKLEVRHAGGQLTVGSQKEFLQLYNRRIIDDGDEVLRGERWVRVGELPWIHGMQQDRKTDNRRLIWITVLMMLLGLLGILWIQSHATTVAKKTGALPPNAVHAVPRR